MRWYDPPTAFKPETPRDCIPFVVQGLIPKSYLTILCGEPKVGKTAFAAALAFAVAMGKPFFGRETCQGTVLWLSFEEGPDERTILFREAPKAILEHTGPIPFLTTYECEPIDTPEGLSELQKAIGRFQPALVVVDSLHAAQSGRSLRDGWAARKTLRGLKGLSMGGTAILVLHHLGGTRHNRRVAESAQLAATSSTYWLLERLPSLHPLGCKDEGPQGGRQADFEKRRAPVRFRLTSRGRGQFANRDLTLVSPSPLEYEIESAEIEPAPRRSLVESAILERLGKEAATAKELVQSLPDLKPQVVRNALTKMFRSNELEADGLRNGSRLYKIAGQYR